MSKKLISDLIKNSTNVETDKVFDNGKKWEANVRGQYRTMTSNEGFSKKQLEQLGQLMDYKLQPIKEDVGEIKHRLDNVEKRLDGVEKRLDNVESDVKELKQDMSSIKSCPTIQKEINAK